MKTGVPRKERVSWTHEEEQALLQLYARARRDPVLRGENGLRMKGWRWLAGEMATRYDHGKIKPVIQSKFARLMREYKLYLWLLKHSDLTQNDDGTVDMDENGWQRLYVQRRADVSVLRRFRQQRGFPLAALCTAANADDGPLESVPNSSAHDREGDEDDDEEAASQEAKQGQPPVAAAAGAASSALKGEKVGAKRGRPPVSASSVGLPAFDAQRPRIARAQVDLPPIHAAQAGATRGRAFSPELESKLSRCLDVVTAYFEASTAVLNQMGNAHSDRQL